jgi:Acetyltransferase (GNAT) family.
MKYTIKTANASDVDLLTATFMKNLHEHPEYISHGEIQMGVGVASHKPDGTFAGIPSGQAEMMWRKYITEKIEIADAEVYMALDENGALLGFSVVDIEEDGADPFGMICDVLVLPSNRKSGVGSALIERDLSWLSSRGIADVYLESGKDNHSAHRYFEKRGFEHVSNIYKLRG